MKNLSCTKEKALFLGNGIHRTESNNGISWGDLLRNISTDFGIGTDLTNELKPFPLAFEEMRYAKEGRNDVQNKLRNLKTRISNILLEDADRMIDNEIHKGFMQSGIKEIITTNYDYNLEKSQTDNFISDKKKYSINNLESKHSLYRGYKIGQVTVRHIHGELKHNRDIVPSDKNYHEESIMIGFEHYSDYFAKIQSVIKGEGDKQNSTHKTRVLVRLKNENPLNIWTDLFFTHDLIFAGFSFDFSENHLWWLLIQREKLKRKNNKLDFKINNEITFCIPQLPNDLLTYNIQTKEAFNQLYRQKLQIQKNKGVTDILRSLGVKIDSIECKSYKEFYLKVIEKYSLK